MNAIKKAHRQITCRPIDIISNYVLMLLSELFLDIPSNGTCAEHGCRRTVEAAYKELCLASECVEHVFIVALLDRVHNQVAGFSEAAEEYKGLGDHRDEHG